MPNEFYKLFGKERYLTADKVSKELNMDKKEASSLLDKLVDANVVTASTDAKDKVHFNFKRESEIKNSSLANLEKDIVRYAKETDFISISKIQYKFNLGFSKALAYMNELICEGRLIKEKDKCYKII